MDQYFNLRLIDQLLLKLVLFAVLSLVVNVLYLRFSAFASKKYSLPRIGKDPRKFSLAAARQDFLENGFKLIKEGYDKYGDSAFVVQTADMERVVLSRRYVHELRSLPEDTLSLRRAMSDRHLGQYTSLNIIQLSHLQNEVCRNQLQQHLNQLIAGIQEEISFGLDQAFGNNARNDFYRVNVYKLALQCIGRAASRSLVGSKLTGDPVWLETAIGYTGDVFAVSQHLRNRHWFLRPFIYALSDARKLLWSRINKGRHYLIPLLEDRAAQSTEKTPDDLLKWMSASAKGDDKAPYRLSDKIMFLCLASIHTSTSTAVHALFDLCTYQNDVLKTLKDEIKTVTEHHGGLTLQAINKMNKLDSFLKESQRLNHPGTLSFNRKVLKNITLSDGIILPAGTFISMPTAMIARDPALYEDPEAFKPWRFAQARDTRPSEAHKHQFASVSADSLPFGLGKYACPGRFFAAALLKQFLIELIMNYDFCFPDGQIKRPENVFLDERIAPNVKQEMDFKRRAAA